MSDDTNVLGGQLLPCSKEPMTGWERDGCCRSNPQDAGRHEICAVMTEEFLQFSEARGNDLLTPRPELEFPGLEPGDHWCVCIDRWLEAKEDGTAPPVVLEATAEAALSKVPPSTLREYEYDPDEN